MKENVKKYSVNSRVYWKWMGREILGFVKEIHTESISKKIKGKTIKRNGSPTNPAYLVESDAGNFALKLHSELQLFDKIKSTAKSPKMFG